MTAVHARRFSAPKGAQGDAPLAIDLDGTLIHTDTLHESILAAVKADPQRAWTLAHALGRGKAGFKRVVADMAALDPARLPYNEELIGFLKRQKENGRTIGLFTAADQSIADSVGAHLGLFDVVCGSRDGINLAGTHKVEAIRATLGERFVYAGDGHNDDPVFAAAEEVILAGPVKALRQRVAGKTIAAEFPGKSASLGAWFKALRPAHWAKNALVFVAPVLSFEIGQPAVAAGAAILFLLMGLIASATYLVNDAFDLAADRAHPKKRHRPMASGAIPVWKGLALAGVLLAISFAAAWALLPPAALLALASYCAITLAYSFWLKRRPALDTIALAGLFTIRVAAGGALIVAPLSPWLLTFSMLFFLGLASVKRYAELERVRSEGGTGVFSRGYDLKDMPLVLTVGLSAGVSAIVLFMIYLIEEQYPQDIYSHPEALWAAMPILLLWTMRLWRLAVHGLMNEDPLIFALRDRISLGLGAALGLVLVWAWL